MRKFKKALAFALASAMIVSAVPVSAATTNKAWAGKTLIYTNGQKSKSKNATWIKVTKAKGYTVKLTNKTKDIISLNGTKVTAKKAGAARVDVSFYKGGKKVSTKKVWIKVRKSAYVQGAKIEKAELTVGETTKVSTTNADEITPYYYSADKNVVTVDKKTGEVTAVGAGSTTISVWNPNTGKSVKVPVTVNAEFAAKQSGASTITVTGTDLANKDIKVTKGSSTVTISKKEVSEDGKTATLTTSGKIVAADYTVTAGDKTSTFKGEASRVENIQVLGENLAMKGDIGTSVEGTVGYKVTNQFNEDITDSTSLEANASSARRVDVSKGTVTVHFQRAPRLNDPVSLVLIYKETGKTASAVLKVSNKALPYTITEKGVYNDNGKALTATNITPSEEFYYLFQVKDQYGNDITDKDVLSGAFYVNCAAGLTNTKSVTISDVVEKTVDGTKYFALPIEKVEDATKEIMPGEITYILTAGGSGQSLTTKVTVEAGSIVNTIDVVAPDVVPAGKEKVAFEFTALDKEGNDVTNVNQLNRVRPANSRFEFVKEGDTVKLYMNTEGLVAGQTYSEVFTTPTYNTKVVLVNIKDATVPTEIAGLKDDVATAQLIGRNIELKNDNFKVNDQYGNSVDLGSYTIRPDATTDSVFRVNAPGSNVLNMTATDSGTKEVTFTLYDGQGKKVENSEFTVTFTAVKESRINSYTVSDVNKIYGGEADATTGVATTPAEYTLEDVDVYGVVSSGVKVKLEKDRDYTINPSTNLTTVSGSGIGYTGKTSSTDLDAKFQVVINNNGQVVEKDTKVSFAKPVVDKIEIKDSKTYLTVSGTSITVADEVVTDAQLKATDTYGKKLTLNGQTATYVDRSNAAVQVVVSDMSFKNDNARVLNNGRANASISNLSSGDSFKVTITIGGKSLTTTVQVQ